MSIRDFIYCVLICEIEDILKHHPYLAFNLMAKGLITIANKMGNFPTKEYFRKIEDYKFNKIIDTLESLNDTMLPCEGVELCESKDVKKYPKIKNYGYCEINGKMKFVLIAEEFFQDYKKMLIKYLKYFNPLNDQFMSLQ